ncbi:MAG: TolC family protein [Myxococcota bacterium]
MVEAFLVAVVLAAEPEPIAFDAAVQRALSAHPAMRIAQQDVARALAQVELTRAPSLPTLAVNGTFTRLDDDRRLGDRLVLGKEQLSGNVQLGVPLINTPRWAQWLRAANGAEAAQATADDVRRQVALAAARAWLTVLGAAWCWRRRARVTRRRPTTTSRRSASRAASARASICSARRRSSR